VVDDTCCSSAFIIIIIIFFTFLLAEGNVGIDVSFLRELIYAHYFFLISRVEIIFVGGI
jgi:hypothetical protein